MSSGEDLRSQDTVRCLSSFVHLAFSSKKNMFKFRIQTIQLQRKDQDTFYTGLWITDPLTDVHFPPDTDGHVKAGSNMILARLSLNW